MLKCIDQQNMIEVHEQISQMSDIYAAAVVVLINEAGSGANHGLPGVGSPRMMDIKYATIGSVSLFVKPHQSLENDINSAWATRVLDIPRRLFR